MNGLTEFWPFRHVSRSADMQLAHVALVAIALVLASAADRVRR